VAALRQIELWRQAAQSRAYALFLVTVALSFVRSRDQPSVDVGFSGTTISVVATDVALVTLAVVSVVVLTREHVGARAVVVTAGLFAGIVLLTGAKNGATAFVSAGKLVELAALGLGALALVRTRARLEALVDLLIVFTAVADVYALVEFVRTGGGRQASFLGEHDFAALATMPLVYGLVLLFEQRTHVPRRAVAAIVVGAVGVALGAALASLLGLYIGAAVLLVLAFRRRALLAQPAFTSVAVVAAVSAVTLLLRSGDLGFLQQWFGREPERPGQYASSWSQRLIYAYVGGRVFLDHPLLGTGWWGELPQREFVRYLPDARRRFPDQPPRYFPPADRMLIPQQTYDQVLYELGIAGGVALLAFVVALIGRCRAAARRAVDRLVYLPSVWLAAALGAIGGEALFGGSPLAAVFWLTAGVVAAVPLLLDA
jgi:hypothetical protein